MIEFKTLKFKNFLSFGQVEQTIELNALPYQIVAGLNKDKNADDDGNRNGCGKSSFMIALYYALYGKSIGNKINLPNLVNNINKRNMETSILFTKDGTDYLIQRGRNPNYLKLFINNGEYVNDESQGDSRDTQSFINEILGMDEDLFSQTILLSCQVPIFLEQSTATQKIILEKVLGIDLLSKKVALLKDKIKSTNATLNNEQFRINLETTQRDTNINSFNSQLNELKSSKIAWERQQIDTKAKYEETINQYKDVDFNKEEELIIQYDKYDSEYKNYNLKMVECSKKKQKLDELQKELQQLAVKINVRKSINLDDELKAHQYNNNLKQEEKEYNEKLKLYTKNQELSRWYDGKLSTLHNQMKNYDKEMSELSESKCPVCGNTIDDKHKDDHKSALINNMDSTQQMIVEMQGKLDEVIKQINEFKFSDKKFEYKETIFKTIEEVMRVSNDISVLEEKLINLMKMVEDLSNEINAYNDIKEPIKPDILSKFGSMTELNTAKFKYESAIEELKKKSSDVNPFDKQIDMVSKRLTDEQNKVIDTILYNTLTDEQRHNEVLLKLLNSPSSFLRKAIIDRALDYLNNRVRWYLSKLGSTHVVTFNSDMSISIVQNGIEFGYVSSGEMGRVAFALTFAFRDVWESLNNNKINLLMIDEVIDRCGLDTNGMFMLHDCIKELKDKNIFVVTHIDSIIQQSQNILKIVKENGFSSIEK